ncbi:adenylate/guanylate cyclase domain-containing protein [Treponema sp.]|uniref:adenylate/guanylate cyclase domain-containing protein n=1 Tax=Treponema sp. TaxID=166 RepID=UPI00298E313D|nr:adenylate/guanylate cyclase domain-containing protein [Treponema sp.]
MNYNIEFQIASIIFVITVMVVFFSKKRWPSTANIVYRVVMFLTLATLLLDVCSVITITKYVGGNKEIEFLNNLLSKLYLVVMLAYIATIDIYAVVNTIHKKKTNVHLTIKYIELAVIIMGLLVAIAIAIANPLLYGGEGKYIYSYGIPSDTVYVYSTASVIFVLTLLVFNINKVSLKRLVPIITFSIMEGSVAIVQMFNKQLLVIGFGTAISCLIMYFALENPDMNMIDELNKANKRSRDLLLNILPLSIANKLEYDAKPFFEELDNVSIMFIDIVGFTKMCSEVGGTYLVKILNDFFGELDDLIANFKVEKIKTIGDAYMIAAGVPDSYDYNCQEIVKLARQILRLLIDFNRRKHTDLHVRIGINNGRVIAGVIGKKKFIYDLWGDSVNLASRLESNGETDRIHVSERVKYLLGDQCGYEPHPLVDMKGFGKLQTYLLT